MKKQLIKEIEQSMLRTLNNAQMAMLHDVLERCLTNISINREEEKQSSFSFQFSNREFISKFISSKLIEGCSDRTIKYYSQVLGLVIGDNEINVAHMTTDDLRQILTNYQSSRNCGKVNIDNIRRILSSFFSWLEEENYIIKSPMKRIHKIKTDKPIKETYTDENIETLRDGVTCLRDLAIIDLLSSTGMRVGELIRLNKNDIDFENRECIVLGKGNKERPVYFDARTKIHLKNYIRSRTDDNPALFVTLDKPFDRLKISGVEIRLRQLGQKLGIKKVHPHKFRRTMATRAIDKGMPIEQVQNLLGHSQIDTTMQYAMVNQNNVKQAHKRYIG